MGSDFTGNVPIIIKLSKRFAVRLSVEIFAQETSWPSVRDLALLYGVNPNTVQSVYMELERLDIVKVRRGQGTYQRLTLLRDQLNQERIAAFVEEMKEMDFTADETASGLQVF
jgi:GntR family transcriptional regulator